MATEGSRRSQHPCPSSLRDEVQSGPPRPASGEWYQTQALDDDLSAAATHHRGDRLTLRESLLPLRRHPSSPTDQSIRGERGSRHHPVNPSSTERRGRRAPWSTRRPASGHVVLTWQIAVELSHSWPTWTCMNLQSTPSSMRCETDGHLTLGTSACLRTDLRGDAYNGRQAGATRRALSVQNREGASPYDNPRPGAEPDRSHGV
jgi:hypothetical protein